MTTPETQLTEKTVYCMSCPDGNVDRYIETDSNADAMVQLVVWAREREEEDPHTEPTEYHLLRWNDECSCFMHADEYTHPPSGEVDF